MSAPISAAIFGRVPTFLVPTLVLCLLVSVSFDVSIPAARAFLYFLRTFCPPLSRLVFHVRVMSDVHGLSDILMFAQKDMLGMLRTALPFHTDLTRAGHFVNEQLHGLIASSSSASSWEALCSSILSAMQLQEDVKMWWLTVFAVLFCTVFAIEVSMRRAFASALKKLDDDDAKIQAANKNAKEQQQQKQLQQQLIAVNLVERNLRQITASLTCLFPRWLFLVTDYALASLAFDVLIVRAGKFISIWFAAWNKSLLDGSAPLHGGNVTLALLARNDFFVSSYLTFVVDEAPNSADWRVFFGSAVVIAMLVSATLLQRVFVFPGWNSLPKYLNSGARAAAYRMLILGLRTQHFLTMAICAAALVLKSSVFVHIAILAVTSVATELGYPRSLRK